jgi:hypothetical protein
MTPWMWTVTQPGRIQQAPDGPHVATRSPTPAIDAAGPIFAIGEPDRAGAALSDTELALWKGSH